MYVELKPVYNKYIDLSMEGKMKNLINKIIELLQDPADRPLTREEIAKRMYL